MSAPFLIGLIARLSGPRVSKYWFILKGLSGVLDRSDSQVPTATQPLSYSAKIVRLQKGLSNQNKMTQKPVYPG